MSNQTIDAILHDLVFVGISFAAAFVKNPNSVQHAASIIGLVNNTVLPLADSFLNPAIAPAPTPLPTPTPVAVPAPAAA